MTLVILDGNNLAMRSYHGAKYAMSAQGESTGALQLFVNALAMHVRAERPDRLVVCWDGQGGSTFRRTIYPDYKAARRSAAAPSSTEPHHDAFALIKRFCDLAGLYSWRLDGVEADDLIAAAWKYHHERERIVILSNDKDMMQLLDDNTEQVRFSSANAKTDRWDRARVIEEMGYTPEQIPLMMALTGDASDGVPGMRGVGPKKALKMLQAADWNLDRAMLPHPDFYSIVKTSHALVDLSWALVAPHEVPTINLTGPTHPAWPALLDFLRHYQMRTIEERLVSQGLWS